MLSLQALAGTSDSEVLPTHDETPEALLVRREQIGYLRDAIEELPERLRTVIKQYFFEQRKMTDIAADLGVTESRVSQMRAEALTLLQASFHATGSAGSSHPVGAARASRPLALPTPLPCPPDRPSPAGCRRRRCSARAGSADRRFWSASA